MRTKHGLRNAAPLTENDLLDRIQRTLAARQTFGSALQVAMGDDAAVFRPRAGFETVLTCDWFLQGTHFLLDRHPPRAVGWKCLARAASDLAAMGAEPRCFLLSLALPTAAAGNWLDQFLLGLQAASRKLNCPAAGGDTTCNEKILINITVVGECRRGRAILRTGAKPGDAIFVSGSLGEAEYGLRLMQSRKDHPVRSDIRLRKHLYPLPRLALGAWLVQRRLASAMMDLSDGLSADLPKLCQASHVGACIHTHRLPRVKLHSADTMKFDSLQLALHGGDDYELLFTVSPQNISRIPRTFAGTSLTRIGEIRKNKSVLLITGGDEEAPLQSSGWDPFKL